MESISHARMSRIVKPVLVPSTVESTKQKVEGILSDEAKRCENHFEFKQLSLRKLILIISFSTIFYISLHFVVYSIQGIKIKFFLF